jgi:hypothetical protein
MLKTSITIATGKYVSWAPEFIIHCYTIQIYSGKVGQYVTPDNRHIISYLWRLLDCCVPYKNILPPNNAAWVNMCVVQFMSLVIMVVSSSVDYLSATAPIEWPYDWSWAGNTYGDWDLVSHIDEWRPEIHCIWKWEEKNCRAGEIKFKYVRKWTDWIITPYITQNLTVW